MATEMLNAGVPLPVVARRLDHARASTTLNFYAQAVPGGGRDAVAPASDAPSIIAFVRWTGPIGQLPRAE